MEITLKRLNQDYLFLRALSAQQPTFPKDCNAEERKQVGKIVYKLGRITEGAERQQEMTNKSLEKLARAFGFELGDKDTPADKIKQFNESAELMLDSNKIKLWGDPFKIEELSPYYDLTGDICKLAWLITDGEKMTVEAYEPQLPTLPALKSAEASPPEETLAATA